MDDRIRTVLSALIRVERERRSASTADAFRGVRDDYTTRSALGHGKFPADLDRVSGAEYEARGGQWIALTQRVFRETETAWTQDTSAAVTNLLQSELLTDFEAVLGTMKKFAAGAQPRMDALDAAQNRVRVQVEQELLMLVIRQDRTRVPLADQLSSQRYAGPAVAWKRSHELLDGDPANAAKEAVAAVEALARIVIQRPAATLGDAVKALRSSERIPGPALKGIEEVWALSSSIDGVRHGASPKPIDRSHALYIVDLAQASLRLLLAHDDA